MAIALGLLFSVVVVLHPLIVHLIPAVLLCFSGLLANLVQAICFICIWPISENAYTRLNDVVKELDWRVRILECIEQEETETSRLKGEVHELVLSNARNDTNRLLDLVLAQWSGFLGSLVAVVKTSARYSPVIGWSMWISEYVSSRSCVHDANLKDFLLPFWLSVVLERTGFVQGDLLAAQRLPVPSKVLSSDTKDLVYAVRRAYSAVPSIYIITVAIPRTSPPPTLESVIKGGHSVNPKLLFTTAVLVSACRNMLG
ncbi:PREDICTED: 1-acyl-sn-glycerol-3-phosphate acyltransferase 2-like [Fragaria vesca subsp. vesca]